MLFLYYLRLAGRMAAMN